MTTECDGEEACQDIINGLKVDLDIYCEGTEIAYSDFYLRQVWKTFKAS